MFSDQDLAQLRDRGTSREVAEQQITNFQEGFPYLQLVKPATIDDGIVAVPDDARRKATQEYETIAPQLRVVKFVPASGAASRMFKDLYAFSQSYSGSDEEYQKLVNDQDQKPIFNFFKHIEKFAFHDDLTKAYSEHGKGMHEAVLSQEYVSVLNTLLDKEGLDYGSLPKGLLKFHRYGDESRTPVEEHLVEGANYCRDAQNNVYLHFTVSPEHQALFQEHVEDIKSKYEQQFGVTYHIAFSEQKPSTDTIAVDMNDEPFRNEDGSLLFRPGGHGALIENLNDLDADLVFIKNIDNVVPDRLKEETYRNKKLLGGVLLGFQKRIYEYLRFLDHGQPDALELTPEVLEDMREFVEDHLCILPADVFSAMAGDEQVMFLREKLDRPIRVCGMVKNEGEPGGGPFWAINPDESVSLQIVESAQINMDDAEQRALWESATHFNPVDIVCSLKNHEGKKYDLTHYVDPQAGFIAKKSKDGRELKAQELPGLWNGAMSDWNTIFVEVPIETFNPVKTVNDLLREQHQVG